MEKIETIEQVLENLDKNRVYKKKNSVLTGILLSIAGIAILIAYSCLESGSDSSIPHFLFVAGFALFITGTLKIFIRKSHYISSGNHMKLKAIEIYFNVLERDKLVRFLESGNIDGIKQLKAALVDGLKLRVMATRDGQLCFSQAIAYISSEYVNVTSVMEHSKTDYQILEGLHQSRK